MRIPLFKRLVITCFNIVFPPFSVLLICGPNADFIFNCLMFLLAVIPSHVHGFYVSLTYFNRKRKVRNGVYPGKPKHLIWSDRVNNGGASDREVARLKRQTEQGRSSRRHASRRTTGLSSSSHSNMRGGTNAVESWDDGYKEYAVSPAMSRMSTRRSGRSQRRHRYYDDQESEY